MPSATQFVAALVPALAAGLVIPATSSRAGRVIMGGITQGKVHGEGGAYVAGCINHEERTGRYLCARAHA